MVAAAVVGSAVVGGIASSQAAKKSAKASANASNAQIASDEKAIEEQRRQFEEIQKLLKPYSDAGAGSLAAQQNILGLNGAQAQQDAYNQIQNSPAMQSMIQQGENSLLQNASATGGLRGGNLQGALSQFRPQLLNQLVNQQYQNLGGITSLGQNAAAQTGNAGMSSANNISSLLQNSGSAQAANFINQGNASASNWNNLANTASNLAGYYAMSKF
jgi:hypothetical protein